MLPWIRSADLVIHSNCTTGIESVLAGRPVLNFLPASDTRANFDVEVAREAGYTATSIEDALQKSSDLLSGRAPAHVWSVHAQAILHNLNGETIPLLVGETTRVLNEAAITSSSVELPKRRPLRNAVRRLVKGDLSLTPPQSAVRWNWTTSIASLSNVDCMAWATVKFASPPKNMPSSSPPDHRSKSRQ